MKISSKLLTAKCRLKKSLFGNKNKDTIKVKDNINFRNKTSM